MPVYPIGPKKYRVTLGSRKNRKDWTIEGTREEAEAFEAKQRLERQQRKAAAGQEDNPRVAPSFFDFCTGRYRLYAEANLKAGTWRNRKYQLASLYEFIGDKPIDRIGLADVERYQAAKRKAKIGPVKINDDIKALTAVLNYAHRAIGFPAEVPTFPDLPERGANKRARAYTEDEVKELYAAIARECPHLLGATVCMINTGMRRGEVLAMEWSWVDLKRGIITIQPNEHWQPKDDEPREVTISTALRPWLEGKRQHPVYVFPTLASAKNPTGSRYTCWPQNQWDAARKMSGVGGSPHVCRHTFASHFLTKVPDLRKLAKVLGHSHTRVTEIYAHFMPGYLDETRDAVSIGVSLKALNAASKRRSAGR